MTYASAQPESHNMQALASEGYPVMRNFCDMKELRRLRLFEKAVDAAAKNPYTRSVTRWILAGLGNGARVAATCASKGSERVAACVLLSYPLLEASPAIGKGGGHPDSSKPLLRAAMPLLFVHTEHNRASPAAELVRVCARIESEHAAGSAGEGANEGDGGAGTAAPAAAPLALPPPRVVVVRDVDAAFSSTQGDPAAASRRALLQVRGLVLRVMRMRSAAVPLHRQAGQQAKRA